MAEDAAFVETPLAATQPIRATPAKARHGTVVAGKEDDGLLLQTEFLQSRQKATHLAVVFVQHGAELALFLRPIRVLPQAFITRHPRRVHVVGPEVHVTMAGLCAA